MQTKVISGFSNLMGLYNNKPIVAYGHSLSIDGHPVSIGMDQITCLDVFSKFLVLGHVCGQTDMASITLYDLETQIIVFNTHLHKYVVKAVKFSDNGDYIVSLGGQDDRLLTITNLAGKSIAGVLTSKEIQKQIMTLSVYKNKFFIAGEISPKLYTMDPATNKISEHLFSVGLIKRVIVSSLFVGNLVLCGTLSGDILKLDYNNYIFKDNGPKKFAENFPKGVLVLESINDNTILIGGGIGTVAIATVDTLQIMKKITLNSKIYDLKYFKGGIYALASNGQLNLLDIGLESTQLIQKSHLNGISTLYQPQHTGKLLLTASFEEVFVWDLVNEKIVQTYKIPNTTCLCLCLNADGSEVYTGWDDGKIRVFLPESGKLKYEILNAHKNKVTALNCVELNNKHHLISGGDEGYLRFWLNGKLVHSLSEHKDSITQILVEQSECISASDDGSCIIWDLTTLSRKQLFFGDNMIKAVVSLPSCLILLDHKVSFFHKNGDLLREIQLKHLCTCAFLIQNDTMMIGCENGDIIKMNIITGHMSLYNFGQTGIVGITMDHSAGKDGSLIKYTDK